MAEVTSVIGEHYDIVDYTCTLGGDVEARFVCQRETESWPWCIWFRVYEISGPRQTLIYEWCSTGTIFSHTENLSLESGKSYKIQVRGASQWANAKLVTDNPYGCSSGN